MMGKNLYQPSTTDYFHIVNFYSFFLFKQGKSAEAISYSDSLLHAVSRIPDNTKVVSEILSNKASALIRNNQNKEGIEVSLKLLENAEKSKDTLAVLKAYTILGWANMELESYPEAIKWLNKGLYYTNDPMMQANSSALDNNIASCYNNLNHRDSAFHYINKGLQYSRQIENFLNQANALNIRAAIYLKENNFALAQKDLEEALKVREKNGDLHYIISDMAQLSSFYSSIHETDKGIAMAQRGIALAQKSRNLSKLIFLNTCLADNYQRAMRKDDYANTLQTIIRLKDSLYEKNSEGAIAEMVTKYELQKKENIIIQQENTLIKNRYFALGSILTMILVSLIVWLVYRNYLNKQQLKMEQALAEEKIHSIKAIQLAEEKERKRIAADLHDNLGSYAAAISSNIRYLKENYDSDNEHLIAQLDENAQGIVTQLSDSIWVLKSEQLPVTNLADRFKAWTQRLIQNYPDVKYHYEEDILNDIEFTPSKMLNIFLILKECLNNALKHSCCSDIRIQFISNTELTISMEDNGVGFQANEQNRGNGIENIRRRAFACELKVEWEPVSPSGTKVILRSATTN